MDRSVEQLMKREKLKMKVAETIIQKRTYGATRPDSMYKMKLSCSEYSPKNEREYERYTSIAVFLAETKTPSLFLSITRVSYENRNDLCFEIYHNKTSRRIRMLHTVSR